MLDVIGLEVPDGYESWKYTWISHSAKNCNSAVDVIAVPCSHVWHVYIHPIMKFNEMEMYVEHVSFITVPFCCCHVHIIQFLLLIHHFLFLCILQGSCHSR